MLSRTKPDHTRKLPPELKNEIVSYLPPRATCAVEAASRDWQPSAADGLRWKALYEDRFGFVPGPLVPGKANYAAAHGEAVNKKLLEFYGTRARNSQRALNREAAIGGGAIATAMGVGISLGTGALTRTVIDRGVRASQALGRIIPALGISPWQVQVSHGYATLVDYGCKLAAMGICATALWKLLLEGGEWLDDRASTQRAAKALEDERAQLDWR
jgi:hypothetical protein